jgi:hypothetical protein
MFAYMNGVKLTLHVDLWQLDPILLSITKVCELGPNDFFIFVPPLFREYLEVEVWYYLQGLGTLCVPNHVDYTCSCVT